MTAHGVTITNDTCHTFTHLVDRWVRVECVAHGVVVDVEPQPKGAQPTARAIARAAQAEHQAEHQAATR